MLTIADGVVGSSQPLEGRVDVVGLTGQMKKLRRMLVFNNVFLGIMNKIMFFGKIFPFLLVNVTAHF